MSLEVTAYAGLGPGIHDVNVTGLEQKTSKVGGPYLRWEFTDGEGKTTSSASSVEMTPGNKTGRWFATLTGRPTVVGEKREIHEVIGKPCTIVQELNAEGYPKITSLLPRQSSAQSPVRPLETTESVVERQSAPTDELPF